MVDESMLPLARAWHWERERADRIWLTQPMGGGQVRNWTWSQAVGEARRVAAWLKAQDFPAGSRIAILSKNCAHWLMCDLAIWMAGHVSVPLYPTLTAESVRQILEHSEARAIFVGKLDEPNGMLPGIPGGVLRFRCALSAPSEDISWEQIVRTTPPLPGTPQRAADELATIIYTSGTTGMPKGVMISFGSFAAAAEPLVELYGVHAEDRMLSYLPLSHVAERWCVEAASLRAGFRLFFAESLDTFLDDLRRAHPTMFISVPRLWVKFRQGVLERIPERRLDMLLRLPLLGRVLGRAILRSLALDQVRFAGSGAAPLPVSVLEWYRRLGLELLEGYGMTENFGFSHSSRPGRARVGYVGEPWPGVECRIDDNGEVLVRSPSTMMGYFKDPERTREALTEDGFLRTGDLGEIDEMGRLRITGRAKELFKTAKGKYVAPAPIENRLSADPAIEAVCVMGAGQAQPCAVAMLSEALRTQAPDADGRQALEQRFTRLLEATNAALDPHERLAFIALTAENWSVEDGALTPTLKIKRNVLEDRYGRRLDAWYASRRPVVWV